MAKRNIDLGCVGEFFVANQEACSLDAQDALSQLLDGADTAISCAMHGVSDGGEELTITVPFLLKVLWLAQSQVHLAKVATRSFRHVALLKPEQSYKQPDALAIYDRVSREFDDCCILACSLEEFIKGDNDDHAIGVVAKNLREKLYSLMIHYTIETDQLKKGVQQ